MSSKTYSVPTALENAYSMFRAIQAQLATAIGMDAVKVGNTFAFELSHNIYDRPNGWKLIETIKAGPKTLGEWMATWGDQTKLVITYAREWDDEGYSPQRTGYEFFVFDSAVSEYEEIEYADWADGLTTGKMNEDSYDVFGDARFPDGSSIDSAMRYLASTLDEEDGETWTITLHAVGGKVTQALIEHHA